MDRLANDADGLLVAAGSQGVVGSAEVVLGYLGPDHQILQPHRAAYVHAVVGAGSRGEGVGRLLVEAAEAWAAAHAVTHVIAGIHSDNMPGTGCYVRQGYRTVRITVLRVISG